MRTSASDTSGALSVAHAHLQVVVLRRQVASLVVVHCGREFLIAQAAFNPGSGARVLQNLKRRAAIFARNYPALSGEKFSIKFACIDTVRRTVVSRIAHRCPASQR